ncbi:MAG: DUF86 domain-containing protein [Nitrospirota bacterium]
MQPEDKVRLQHMLDEANEACKYAENISFDDFLKDGKTARAIIRSVEVIGEAASKVSDELRREHSEVPWQKIVGMRNRLIHVYFDIDYHTLWQTVKENLPALIEQISSIVTE